MIMRGKTFRAPRCRRAGGRPFDTLARRRARPVTRALSVKSAGHTGMSLLRHELRTPLTGILGMASLLQELGLAGEQRHYVLAVQESGLQMKRLIERVTRRTPAPAPGNLTRRQAFSGLQLLQLLIRAHWPLALRKGIGLYLAFDHGLAETWHCDPACLRQLLDNLLANAVKFTHRGHVLLDARSGGLNANGKWDVVLTVHDTGIGISAADDARIYAVRDQGSGDVCQTYGGSGLGLYVCERIVSRLGGRLRHQRNGRGGSSFTIVLPGVAEAGGPVTSGRLRPALLAGLRCQLGLAEPAQRAIWQILRRAGVQPSGLQAGQVRRLPANCDALICHAGRLGQWIRGLPGTGRRHELVLLSPLLQPADPAAGKEQRAGLLALPQPVLQSNLEPLLLQLALRRKLQGG
jgi:hypothetical protein